MTIKIHNGFTLNQITSLDDVQPYIKKITKKLTEIADSIWGNIVVSDACILYDSDTIAGNSQDKAYMADALEAVEEDLVSAFRRRIPSQLDLEILLFFKLIKGKNPYVVGLHNIPNDELRFKFNNLEGVRDFSYYSGDKPNDVSKSEWRKRELAWKGVFKATGLPETSMFSINILKSEPRPIKIDTIEQMIPSLELRAENLASKKVINELKSKEVNFNTQKEVFDYLKSSEHINNVKTETSNILSRLDKELTISKLGINTK